MTEAETSFTVGEACRMIHPDLLPAVLSNHLYRSRMARDWPVRGGRKLIPSDCIDALRSEMRRAGKLPAEGLVAHV